LIALIKGVTRQFHDKILSEYDTDWWQRPYD
jgi:hypothetical protein